MTLGERIIKLRTDRKLTQLDLAEALGVSRQAISKWETDSSVPELDKLIQLCQVLDVTMDYLVRGIESDSDAGQRVRPVHIQDRNPNHTTRPKRRIIAGIIFLVLGAIGTFFFLFTFGLNGALASFLYPAPFYLWGILCLTVKRRPALYCGWAAFFYGSFFMAYGTTISWRLVFLTFRFTEEMNYMRLIIAWVHVLFLLLLVAGTVYSFRKISIRFTKSRSHALLAAWILFLAAETVHFALTSERYYGWTTVLIDNISFLMITLLLVVTYHYFRFRRQNKPAH